MATAARVALRPNNEAPRQTLSQRVERGTTNYINSSTAVDTADIAELQPGRIVALHWWRGGDDVEQVHPLDAVAGVA